MTSVSTKPYLIRAIYEWCVDQGLSPHLVVQVDEQVSVPPGYARNGQIVLDVSPEATHQLVIGNEDITFQARFGGVAHSLYLPVSHVLAIYAGENGHGMAFEPESPQTGETAGDGDSDASAFAGDDEEPQPPEPSPGPSARRSHLKIIK